MSAVRFSAVILLSGFFAACTGFGSGSAATQQAASPATGTPEGHAEAARALLEITEVESTIQEGMEMMLTMQAEQNPMLAEMTDILRDFVAEFMKWEDLEPDFVALYTEVFTEAEMLDLLAFYRTDLGKRLITVTPELMQKSSVISQNRMEANMPELTRRIMERMQGPPE